LPRDYSLTAGPPLFINVVASPSESSCYSELQCFVSRVWGFVSTLQLIHTRNATAGYIQVDRFTVTSRLVWWRMRGKGPRGHGRDELSHVAKLKNIPRLDPRRSVVIFSLQDPPSVDPRLDTGVVSKLRSRTGWCVYCRCSSSSSSLVSMALFWILAHPLTTPGDEIQPICSQCQKGDRVCRREENQNLEIRSYQTTASRKRRSSIHEQPVVVTDSRPDEDATRSPYDVTASVCDSFSDRFSRPVRRRVFSTVTSEPCRTIEPVTPLNFYSTAPCIPCTERQYSYSLHGP
ncbi:hypothetical protein KCU76_g10, partial [Aureobasidium melanogenum]